MQEFNSENNQEIFLDEVTLSLRWHCSPRTLQQTRWKGQGCSYTKIGRLVRYSLVDIEAYEASNTVKVGGHNG